MVDNPADLVQPRSDVPPAYTARRTTVIEQYRVGKPTGAQAPTGTNSPGKITDIGQ
jgi:type IV pilus biogenesis protein CpaD/CtpE